MPPEISAEILDLSDQAVKSADTQGSAALRQNGAVALTERRPLSGRDMGLTSDAKRAIARRITGSFRGGFAGRRDRCRSEK